MVKFSDDKKILENFDFAIKDTNFHAIKIKPISVYIVTPYIENLTEDIN